MDYRKAVDIRNLVNEIEEIKKFIDGMNVKRSIPLNSISFVFGSAKPIEIKRVSKDTENKIIDLLLNTRIDKLTNLELKLNEIKINEVLK